MASHSRIVDAVGAIAAFACIAGTVSVVAHQTDIRARSASARRPIPVTAAPTASATTEPAMAATSTSLTLPPPTTTTAATAARPSLATTTAPTALRPAIAAITVAPTTTSTIAPTHQWAVGTVTLSLLDPSRSTPAAGTNPALSSRSLPTIVRYPVDGSAGGGDLPGAAPSHLGGPYPLIVFAHGFDSSPAAYAGLLRAWASAGYVVAAPAFPRGLQGGPLDEADLANEPGDISFVITRLLAANSTAGVLSGVINTARIGVAGQSDGGVAALGVGYNTCCRDGRISADLVGSGDEQTFSGSYFPAGSPPLLVVQGDHDPLNPPADGRAVFLAGRSPKYLLWLLNAGHIEPFSTDLPHLAVVEAVSTAFFDRYLKGAAGAAGRIVAGATPGLATLTAG